MPTQSEYQQLLATAANANATNASTANETPQLPSYCADLESAFQQSPELRAAFGCTIQGQTQTLQNDCDAISATIENKIKADLDACIQPCLSTYEQCNACIRGTLLRDMDIINAVDQSCRQKIEDRLMFVWHDLVAAMNKIGVPPLTDSDIQTILAGGDVPAPVPPVPDVPPDYQPPPPPPDVSPQPPYPPPYTPPPPSSCPPGTYQLPDGTCVTQFGLPPTPPGVVPPIAPRPPICPPGTVALGDGTCSGPIGPPQPPLPPAPQPTYHEWVQYACGATVGVRVGLKDSDVTLPLPSLQPDGETWIIAGPFGLGSSGGSDWIGQNQAYIQQFIASLNCPGQPPPPPPPLPPQPSNCPQCQAGYEWSTDSNGNPVCKPTCNCPQPPPPPPPPPPPSTLPGNGAPGDVEPPGPTLCGPGKKSAIEQWITDLASKSIPDQPTGTGYGLGPYFRDYFSWLFNPLSTSGNPDFFAAAKTTLSNIITDVMKTYVTPFFPADSCNIPAAIFHAFSTGVIRLLDHTLGVVPTAVSATVEQQANYICQYRVPSTPDINTAWVHGVLDDDEWEFGVKLNGDCIDWQDKLIDSSYLSPTWQDAFRLKRLDKIDSDIFSEIFKRNGINLEKHRDWFEKAYDQYPALGDLIRMLVRDSADEQAVEDNEFDKDFDKKWTGLLQQWGNAQGVSDDVAKYYWRAHWQLPSPGQLYEMLHRLRPNDRDPDDPFKDYWVDQTDVQSVLEQNDMAPAWVRGLMAISYSVLSRVDIRRGYEIGELSKDDVRRSYLDRGYNAKDATHLTNFAVLSSAPKIAANNGAMSLSELAKAFNERLISDDEYSQGVKTVTGDDKRTESIVDNQRFKRDVAERKTIVKAIRKRFMFGEFPSDRTVTELLGYGVSLEQATGMVTLWEVELAAKYKAPTVAMLCEWFQRGMIDFAEYQQRVRNIGFDPDDALRIINVCALKRNEKLVKEAEAAQKKREAAAEKAKKAAEKAARDAMPCRPTKPACPMPKMNGTGNGKK